MNQGHPSISLTASEKFDDFFQKIVLIGGKVSLAK